MFAEKTLDKSRLTWDWCKNDPDLVASIVKAKAATKVYKENDYPDFNQAIRSETKITVSKKRTYQAAMDLYHADESLNIAVLNFANAFHPGGGVASGSSAQEESLCRCSTLDPLLYRRSLRDEFYDYHAKLNDSKATDALIYTPGVVICKTDTDLPERMDKKDWVEITVLTCAAPDLRKKSNSHAPLVGSGTYMNNAELFGYHVRRAIHILTVAAAEGIDALVLGAFGCGAFQNDPAVVARAYRTALNEFSGIFRQIEFAVYCTPGHEENYEAFSRMFQT